jgi:hypothetical protein
VLREVAQTTPSVVAPSVPAKTSRRFAWMRSRIFIAVVLAVGVYLVDVAAPISASGGDTLWSVPVAYSVVHHRNVYLDEFPNLLASTKVHTRVVHGHRVFLFPWGPSVVSAPLVAGYDAWLHLRGSSLREYLNSHFAPADLEIRLASFYVALSTALLFLLVLRRVKRLWLALFVSVAFAFGTSMFSEISRALWSHAPSVFLLVTALFLLQIFEDHPEWRDPHLTGRGALVAGACGFALGLGYFVRPTDLVPMVVLVVAIALRRMTAGLAALAGAAIPLAGMLTLNLIALGKPLQGYYEFNRARPSGTYVVALAGNLVSPARGLFVWSPFLLLALPAAVRAVRHPRRDRVLTVCCVVIVLHWLAIASLRPWWAGWSVGPRLFSDVLPFFVLLVADTLTRLPRWSTDRRTFALYAGVGVLVAFSFFTHIRAATHESVPAWNATPLDVDTHSDRPWDWSDPQFLR